MAGAQTAYGERAGYGDVSLRKVLIVSVIFHLIVLVGLPLMSKLFVKPVKFERPATFQLVQMPPSPPKPAPKTPTPPAPVEPPPAPVPPPPTPQPTPAPTPTPKPPTPKPTPTPPKAEQPKPTPKEETVSKPAEENTDDLMALLNEIPLPQAQISAPGTPPHPYINPGVRGKIERNLERITYNSKIAVVVSFEIHSDGSAHNIRVTSSSGDATIDNWGKNAVTRAAPFGKLPWPDKNMIEIDITLRPTRKN